jgi:hypothetical protein
MKNSRIIVIAALFTSFAALAADPAYLSSCKVSFPNGYNDTADCKGRIAVIDAGQKVQCAPKANIVEKDGKFFFAKNRTAEPEPITLCSHGASVKG